MKFIELTGNVFETGRHTDTEKIPYGRRIPMWVSELH